MHTRVVERRAPSPFISPPTSEQLQRERERARPQSLSFLYTEDTTTPSSFTKVSLRWPIFYGRRPAPELSAGKNRLERRPAVRRRRVFRFRFTGRRKTRTPSRPQPSTSRPTDLIADKNSTRLCPVGYHTRPHETISSAVLSK